MTEPAVLACYTFFDKQLVLVAPWSFHSGAFLLSDFRSSRLADFSVFIVLFLLRTAL